MSPDKYEPLTIETLADRLGSVEAICKIVGDDTSKWKINEVGDGNLNLVYTVSSNSCLLYTSPSPRDTALSRMPSSA